MKKLKVTLVALALSSGPVAAQHEHHALAKPLSSADSALLEQQVIAARRATERYLDHANAVADGYRKFGADGPLMGEHWYHPDAVKGPLDIRRPATLQYAMVDGKRTLIGVAYNVYQRPGEDLPAGFAGSSDVWHVHDMPKLARAFVEDRPLLRRVVNRRIEQGKVGAGGDRTQLVMLHAWLWSENPDGMFAQQHRALPYRRAGLPAEWSNTGDTDAAWGTALLRNGCTFELQRLERLARTTRSQQKELTAACETATSQVKAAAQNKDATAFNQTASRAWKAFSTLRDRVLTADQLRRLNSVMEPMHPGVS